MSDLYKALSLETVDTLKKHYLTLFGAKPKPTRKEEIARALVEGLSDPDRLTTYWRGLSDLEQTFVREAVFHYSGQIQRSRFETKYKKFPEQPQKYGSIARFRGELADALKVFFYPHEDRYAAHKIPAPLLLQLKSFIGEPEPDVIPLRSLSDVLLEERVLFERERSAMSELQSLLISLQNKQLKVSEKTGLASAATIKKISQSMHEYYQEAPCEDVDGMESIVTHGWLKLLGNSKFCKQSKTTLVPAQKVSVQTADTIKAIWEQWLNNRTHDEFRRIDNIKGQTGKGSRYFTNVVDRRQAIIEALKECRGQASDRAWVTFSDFSDYMFITGSSLTVTSAPEYLYICEAHYGVLCNAGWKTLEANYLRCFLAEYVATLGLVDVIMADPRENEVAEWLWGTEDMDYLSRYDGLMAFRLTSLGEYVLGLNDSYQTADQVSTETTLTIYRHGRIVFGSEPSAWEQQFLSLYAERECAEQKQGNMVWKLSRRQTMETLQVGSDIGELKQFLLARADQPFLPEDCEGLLKQAENNLDGVKIKHDAFVITCKNEEIANLIANDKIFSKWCQRLDKLQIIVPKNKEKVFRENLNAMGIGCS